MLAFSRSHRRWSLLLFAVGCCLLGESILADGPADNDPTKVRAVPPEGIPVPPQIRTALNSRADAIDRRLEALDPEPPLHALVAVFPRAVRMTLETDMFYSERDLKSADALLDEAQRRIEILERKGNHAELLGLTAAHAEGPQLLVGGFQSDIDDSIQPYGLVLPARFQAADLQARTKPLRLDVWLHGRGERVSEVAFLQQRMQQVGEYAPEDTIVLHPYGRYSNAFKFAGEIDVLEAIEHVSRLFPIDDSRITIRGFSMGGAGCWQLAVHYPNLWAAANPGAGFSETTQFLKVFQQEEFVPTAYQKKLLHWYDCPDWTNNLRNVPTVAYSGEIDQQKQAADVMQAAFTAAGMHLPHIIGPQTAHKIHPESKVEIESFLSEYLADGKQPVPPRVDLTTYSLRYNRVGWLQITGLAEHWQAARVQGELGKSRVTLTTSGVTQLVLDFPSNQPFALGEEVEILIDEQSIASVVDGTRHWRLELAVQPDTHRWQIASKQDARTLSKRPGLQGPIDDAFMSAFVFVPPDSPAGSGLVDRWVAAEYQHATQEWMRQMRGDIVALAAADVADEMIANHNLVLFGTPETNSLIAKLVDRLPLEWSKSQLEFGGESFDASRVVPVLIYPNPMNPDRYVVLNSGFTYREYAYLNNARQIPMLPDWAMVDVAQGATSQHPGNVLSAGFFDEQWRVTKP